MPTSKDTGKITKPVARTQPQAKKRKTNRRAEVIEAAALIFWEKGYRAASIQDVAEKVGVLKGSLYYYIDSKEDLLWAIVEKVHAQSSAILEQALALDASPIERIGIYIARHVEWYLANVQDVSVFFREWQHLTGDRLNTVKAHRRGYQEAICELIADAQAAGEASPDLDLTHATLYILAAVNSVPDWFRPGRRQSAPDIAEAYANMTIGLLAATRATADPLGARTAA